ncbi:hypothetical protein HDU83_008071 [Entophlyctis luteolus]|nr:hypothetical protein HDU83_008071 [Entophlyctis luteolus]
MLDAVDAEVGDKNVSVVEVVGLSTVVVVIVTVTDPSTLAACEFEALLVTVFVDVKLDNAVLSVVVVDASDATEDHNDDDDDDDDDGEAEEATTVDATAADNDVAVVAVAAASVAWSALVLPTADADDAPENGGGVHVQVTDGAGHDAVRVPVRVCVCVRDSGAVRVSVRENVPTAMPVRVRESDPGGSGVSVLGVAFGSHPGYQICQLSVSSPKQTYITSFTHSVDTNSKQSVLSGDNPVLVAVHVTVTPAVGCVGDVDPSVNVANTDEVVETKVVASDVVMTMADKDPAVVVPVVVVVVKARLDCAEVAVVDAVDKSKVLPKVPLPDTLVVQVLSEFDQIAWTTYVILSLPTVLPCLRMNDQFGRPKA